MTPCLLDELSSTAPEETVRSVEYIRTRRSRRIRITLEPFRPIQVFVPERASMKRAQAFVAEKASWIASQLHRVRSHEERHAELRRTLPSISPTEARTRLLSRLRELAARHDFTFTRASVRRQRTLWGSCSARNAISLNINLVYLPEHLMDYVLLHELMHTRIKNHGPKFWSALDEILGNAKSIDKGLRHYNSLLTAPRAF